MRTRTLRLNKETLAELSTEDLDLVVGASGLSCGICINSDLVRCVTFGVCDSLAGC